MIKNEEVMPLPFKIGKQQKFINRFLSVIRKPMEPAFIISIAFYTVLIMVVCGVVENEYKVWAVQVNGKTVAQVSNPAETRMLLRELAAEKSQKLEKPVDIAPGVKIVQVYPENNTRLQGNDLKNVLGKDLSFITTGAVLLVDHDVKLVLRDKEEANSLIAKLKEPYAGPNTNVSFEEDVSVKEMEVNFNELVDQRKGLEILQADCDKPQTHCIQEGDTLWNIASEADMSVEQLLALNPDLSSESLKVGEIVALNTVEPVVNVLATTKQTDIQQVAYAVEEIRDNSLYFGDEKVIQEGKMGQKAITYEITQRNGVMVDRKIIKEDTLEEPQNQIVAKGSKFLLASRAGGSSSLGWPKVGSLNSPFGMRSGRMHTGIDISGNTGDPVAASASGKVVRATWYSGYGKCVDIQHDEGVITRYGHLSEINVSSGEYVERGQLIGKVGTTGRVTGPHLHFEIIVNGEQKNPLDYL